MNKRPLVSIIIPTYNRACLIGETLDSLIEQVYRNWECIIVDDGSTDGTDKLIEKYLCKDERFQYYRRPSNLPKGVSSSRNYGIEKARGDYINFFDSDDIMLPDFLNKRIQIFIQKPETEVVFCAYKCFDQDGIQNQTYNNSYSGNIIDDLFNSRVNFGPLSYMLKAELIDGIRFNPNIHSAEDTEFFFNIFTSKSLIIENVAECLYYVRRNHDSIVSKFDKEGQRLNSLLTVNKKLLRYSIRHNNEAGIEMHKIRCLTNLKNMADNKNFLLAINHIIHFDEIRLRQRATIILFILSTMLIGKGALRIKNMKI